MRPSSSTATQLSNEVVVVFVCANPKPDDKLTMLLCKSAIVIADSDRPDVSNERLELHRRVERVTNPQLKLLSRETLHVSW
jgi:hypothetical protein